MRILKSILVTIAIFGFVVGIALLPLAYGLECVPAPTQDATLLCPICGGDDFHIMTTVQEPIREIWMLECANKHCSHKLSVGRVEG